jgi:transcriptional regulator GlxA family with amidase domain
MKPLFRHFDWETESEGSRRAFGSSAPEVQERRLRQVIDMIESDPSCSIKDLASKVSLSPTHLQRLFKQQTGTQLGSLVAERRLQKAAQLLTTSNLSIKEIAHSVGYGHHSSFVRAFQRRFSQAPKHYRLQPDALGTEHGSFVFKS